MPSEAFLRNLQAGGGEWTVESQRNFEAYQGIPPAVGEVIADRNAELEVEAIVAEEAQAMGVQLPPSPMELPPPAGVFAPRPPDPPGLDIAEIQARLRAEIDGSGGLEAAPNPPYGAQVNPERLRAMQAASQEQQGMGSAQRVAASERNGFQNAAMLARRFRQQQQRGEGQWL